ncbi:uncharacterized protein [Onthophagus taurus]|nr:uncharacterized protein LOC111422567 isoform X2 [Onthophagus taurus]XP_022911538.1 uncharacterized protein LOC111422567 isoform X2 [Onthophagus taurus]
MLLVIMRNKYNPGIFLTGPNCTYASRKIKYSIDGEVNYDDSGNYPLLGGFPIPETISCDAIIKASVVAFDEDGVQIGESDIANIPPCEKCIGIMHTRYDSDNMNIIVSITTPPTSDCTANNFKIKCVIDETITYTDINNDDLGGTVKLNEPLTCKAELSILAYGKNGKELWETDSTTLRVNGC